MYYHAEFGLFALKDGEPQNWRSLELHCLGMGGVSNPQIHTSPQHVLHAKCSQQLLNVYDHKTFHAR